MSGSSPEYVEKAYSFLKDALQKDDAGVGLMLRCCGAPADWAGRKELFANSQSEFRAEYEKLAAESYPSCSSCYQMFQKHYPDVEILSFRDVMNDHGNSLNGESAAPVTIHDPCSTRYGNHIQDPIRDIIIKWVVRFRNFRSAARRPNAVPSAV
ncbi:MAG: (Fe-S)-binding protein [Anaerolineales bacterium]|nr:(Fe-S)-binding protein [Anaerolineales bacterium]